MTNDDIGEDETLEETVEEETETKEEDSEDEEDSKDWQAEANKWKAIATRNKTKTLKTKAKEPEDNDLRSDVAFLKTSEKKRQFGHEYSLSPDETDKIFQINPSPTADTLKDPFVKAGIEEMRRSKRVDDNTPSSSAKSNPINTQKFKDLSASEKEVKFQEYMRAKGLLQ